MPDVKSDLGLLIMMVIMTFEDFISNASSQDY